MWFFKKQELSFPVRSFAPAYLLDSQLQQAFEKDGYAVGKNLIKSEEIEEISQFFLDLQKKDGYDVNQIFESSGNFNSIELQKEIFDFIDSIMHKVTGRFANLDNCSIGKGGAFFIKPNSDKSRLEPHQDSCVIDEVNSYGMFVWIPIVDIDDRNGPLYVLPKSHLWGNSYRSQHIPWSFRKLHKKLWKHMIPIPVKKGDVIFFDTSIIHASEVNNSDEFRIALAGALLPKTPEKVEYLLKGKEVIRYNIDDQYWLNGGQESALERYEHKVLPYTFPNPIKYKNVVSLIEHYK